MSFWTDRRPVHRARAVDAEGIARAALALLDEGGLEALTMRAVAATLGVAPSSLYSRVRSLEDVLDLALDAALGADPAVQELVRARATGPEVLDELLLRHFRHLRRHPWTLQVLPRRALRGPHHLALSERMCGLLEQEGARDPLAAAYALSNLVIGSAMTSTLDEEELATPVDERLAPVYARLHGAGAADSEDVLRLGLVALRQALTAP
jgi:AcrR family transcriptional regulator